MVLARAIKSAERGAKGKDIPDRIYRMDRI